MGIGTSPPMPAPPLVAPDVQFAAPPRASRSGKDDSHEFLSPAAKPWLGAGAPVTVARLIVVVDGNETSFPLVRDSYTLGRHRNNDIVVGDPRVSSFHARIDRTGSGFSLTDLGSRNGTWVSGRRSGPGGPRYRRRGATRLGPPRSTASSSAPERYCADGIDSRPPGLGDRSVAGQSGHQGARIVRRDTEGRVTEEGGKLGGSSTTHTPSSSPPANSCRHLV